MNNSSLVSLELLCQSIKRQPRDSNNSIYHDFDDALACEAICYVMLNGLSVFTTMYVWPKS